MAEGIYRGGEQRIDGSSRTFPMEVMLKRSSVAKQEIRVQSPPVEVCGGTTCKKLEMEASRRVAERPSDSSLLDRKFSSSSDQDEQLETTRAEMGEVQQENERLKTILARIVKDYQSLQMHFLEIAQQDDQYNRKPAAEVTESIDLDDHQTEESDQLVSLSLGRTSSGRDKSEQETRASTVHGKTNNKEDEQARAGLSLSLDCKFNGSITSGGRGYSDQQNSGGENSIDPEHKEEEQGEPWPPSKMMMKTPRSGEDDDDVIYQQPHLKKARVSVRARCDAPTMNDGCQWRKYGQKISKGNPCPRAYYRCTVAPACPVRKQVQRCAEDMSILITTYEGTHNHPLPISATAMASTTSAAASMLMSGSSTSPPAIVASSVPVRTTADGSAAGIYGLNFGLPDATGKRQLYFPSPSHLPPSLSHPTVTLDLTTPASSSPFSAQFSRFSSTLHSGAINRYGSTSFNFSSVGASTTSASSSWSTGYLTYPAHGPQSNKSQISFLNLGKQYSQDQGYQSHLQKAANAAPPPATNGQQGLAETIAAATKAITSDPSFHSALAAAITSIVGGQETQGAAEKTAALLGCNINQLIKREEQLPTVTAPLNPSASAGNECAPGRYLARFTPSNTKLPPMSNHAFPQTSASTHSSKSASASPVRSRD